MAAIGILGGMGPQASARLFELLIGGTNRYSPARVDSDYHPEIVLLNVPVPDFISDKKDLEIAKQMLIERTIQLEQAGCIINGIACNTAHILLPDLQAVTKVPFLSIPKLVVEQIKQSKFKRVGLLATPSTLSSSFFDEALQDLKVELVRPSFRMTAQVENYIYKQLSNDISKKDVADFRRLVADFRRQKKLDAVILGCTELPLIYGQPDDMVIDTLQLLADALLETYFTQVKQQTSSKVTERAAKS